jgi:hypothetical protein
MSINNIDLLKKNLINFFTDDLLAKHIIEEYDNEFKEETLLKKDIDYCKKYISSYNDKNLIHDWDNYCKIEIKSLNNFLKSYLKHALNCNEIYNNYNTKKINLRRFIIVHNKKINDINNKFKEVKKVTNIIFILFLISFTIHIYLLFKNLNIFIM